MGENKSDSVGTIFMREVARATPWGLMIIVVVLICLGFFNYTGKKLISYAQQNAANTVRQIATDQVFVEGVKRNIKEGIEYTLTKAGWEIRSILKDPELKQDMKEALEYTGEKIRK